MWKALSWGTYLTCRWRKGGTFLNTLNHFLSWASGGGHCSHASGSSRLHPATFILHHSLTGSTKLCPATFILLCIQPHPFCISVLLVTLGHIQPHSEPHGCFSNKQKGMPVLHCCSNGTVISFHHRNLMLKEKHSQYCFGDTTEKKGHTCTICLNLIIMPLYIHSCLISMRCTHKCAQSLYAAVHAYTSV